MIGSAAKAMAMSAALHKKGIWVSAIRPPTVPQNEARLRITLSAAHSEEQIDRLIHALADISGDILKGRDILEVMPHEQ